MTKRDKIRVNVWDTRYEYDVPLSEFIKTLQEQLNKHSDQNLKVDLESWEEYNSTECKLEIYYMRDENDEEYNNRIDRENNLKERRIADAKKLLGIT